MSRRATMETVAREAGVSKSTVSRALHSPELLKPETVHRILSVAKQQNYVFDPGAPNAQATVANSIGLIVASVEDSIQSALINGVQEAASRSGYGLLIQYSNHHRTPTRVLLSNLMQRNVSGIIFSAPNDEDEKHLAEAADAGIPVVVTWETPRPVEKLAMVGFDNYAAAYAITDYLCTIGHRRIAIITAPRRSLSNRISERYNGYLDAIRNNYGADVETFDIDMPIPTFVNGLQAMRRILDSGFDPTAVFAVGDALAFGAIRAAYESSLRVPEDISIAGFDNTDIATVSCPSLTSANSPIYEMGQVAVDTLIEAIDSGSLAVTNTRLDTSLVVRESCAPPQNDTGIS